MTRNVNIVDLWAIRNRFGDGLETRCLNLLMLHAVKEMNLQNMKRLQNDEPSDLSDSGHYDVLFRCVNV